MDKLINYIDVDKFVEWLETKRPNEIVGNVLNNRDCPLYNFLFSIVKEPFFSIGVRSFQYYISGYSFIEDMPRWATDYQMAMIENLVMNTFKYNITAQESLNYMRKYISER